MFSLEERYKFYTNNILNKELDTFLVPKEFLNHQQNMPLYVSSGKILDCKEELNCPFMVIADDGFENYKLPCLQKTRRIKDHSRLSIIFKLQAGRHWAPLDFKDTNKWENKKNQIIWRGSPTGNGDRIEFCNNYKDKHNVGLTCVWDNIKQYSYLIRREVSLYEMCNYKYIISIEGNDKDSGLNWKLNSNSLVLMKEPTLESWLMESYLKPWIHYVPLNKNLTDLEEKFNWCLDNDEKCREIVENANDFMSNFKNLKEEKKIIEKIIENYCNYIVLNTEI